MKTVYAKASIKFSPSMFWKALIQMPRPLDCMLHLTTEEAKF